MPANCHGRTPQCMLGASDPPLASKGPSLGQPSRSKGIAPSRNLLITETEIKWRENQQWSAS